MKLLCEQVFRIHQLDVMLVYLYYSLYLLLTAIILLQLQLILQGQNLPFFSSLLLLLLLLVITTQLVIISRILLEIVFLQPSSDIIIQTLLNNIPLHTQENAVLLKFNLFFSIGDFVDYFGYSNQLLLSKLNLMRIRFAQNTHFSLESPQRNLINLLYFNNNSPRSFSRHHNIQKICLISNRIKPLSPQVIVKRHALR